MNDEVGGGPLFSKSLLVRGWMGGCNGLDVKIGIGGVGGLSFDRLTAFWYQVDAPSSCLLRTWQHFFAAQSGLVCITHAAHGFNDWKAAVVAGRLPFTFTLAIFQPIRSQETVLRQVLHVKS